MSSTLNTARKTLAASMQYWLDRTDEGYPVHEASPGVGLQLAIGTLLLVMTEPEKVSPITSGSGDASGLSPFGDQGVDLAPWGWVVDPAGPYNGHRPARPGEEPIPGSVPVVRFKVGDRVRYADFEPMVVSYVHDSHGLSYETQWPGTNEHAGHYVHEHLRPERVDAGARYGVGSGS